MTMRPTSRLLFVCFLGVLLAVSRASGQSGRESAQPPAQQQPPPDDPLGRSTPRGTLMGFLSAARKEDDTRARQYLNTRLNAAAAEELARQLFVVLDARLPARLTQVSDAREGSRTNPLDPDVEIVGSVAGRAGSVDIVVERMRSARSGPIWLFSSQTLSAIPTLYADVVSERQQWLPAFLQWRLAQVRLVEAISVVLGLVLLYLATTILSRVLNPLTALVWRSVFRRSGAPPHDVLPASARLLLMCVVARWLSSIVPLSLLVRQFVSNVASLFIIVCVAWVLIVLNAVVERHLLRRVSLMSAAAAVSLLRVGRRVVDLVVVLVALFVTLRHFGVDPTPVIAGLGVGGLAVALAAQKTLENVIAGASLIFDQAVRVGDFLKVGEIEGTVDAVGLRSTRIRTLDRTIVSVPNGQIATMSLETLSARDKFWFHPTVRLGYDTTPHQLHAVLDGIRDMLARHQAIDPSSVRVRFLRLGPLSLDVDVVAYVFARDWNQFLEIQEQLLFAVTSIVRESGAGIALPSQAMYVNA